MLLLQIQGSRLNATPSDSVSRPKCSPVSTDTESGFFRKRPVGSSTVGDWSSGGASAQEKGLGGQQ